MLWVMGGRGVIHGIHYLDDFLVLGPPRVLTCTQQQLPALRASGISCHSLQDRGPVIAFIFPRHPHRQQTADAIFPHRQAGTPQRRDIGVAGSKVLPEAPAIVADRPDSTRKSRGEGGSYFPPLHDRSVGGGPRARALSTPEFGVSLRSSLVGCKIV